LSGEKLLPKLASDIMDRGIVMAGGGSLLKGLDKTGQPGNQYAGLCLRGSPAGGCKGTGKVLENIEVLKRVLIKTQKIILENPGEEKC
jgi:rod shape-determining protein MreB